MVGERFEKELQEKLSLELEEDDLAGRQTASQEVLRRRGKERDRALNELSGRTGGFDNLMQVLSTCIRCHNCMNVCPICYCKERVFESSAFEHRSTHLLSWANR